MKVTPVTGDEAAPIDKLTIVPLGTGCETLMGVIKGKTGVLSIAWKKEKLRLL